MIGKRQSYFSMIKMNIIFVMVALCLATGNAQMGSLEDILKCGTQVKKFVMNFKDIVEFQYDPHWVVKTAANVLVQLPDLLSTCGKPNSAKLMTRYLSSRCVELFELEASFAIRKWESLKEEQTAGRSLAIAYTTLSQALKKAELQHCTILSIDFAEIVKDLTDNECTTEGRQLIKNFKQGTIIFNQSGNHSLYDQLLSPFIKTALLCNDIYGNFVTLKCLSQLKSFFDFVLTMNNYQTSTHWMWQHIRKLKKHLETTKQQCSNLVLLLETFV